MTNEEIEAKYLKELEYHQEMYRRNMLACERMHQRMTWLLWAVLAVVLFGPACLKWMGW